MRTVFLFSKHYFQIVSEDQNLTLTVNEDSVGTYLCQAETDGFAALTSRPAEVLMTGPPKITTLTVQVKQKPF